MINTIIRMIYRGPVPENSILIALGLIASGLFIRERACVRHTDKFRQTLLWPRHWKCSLSAHIPHIIGRAWGIAWIRLWGFMGPRAEFLWQKKLCASIHTRSAATREINHVRLPKERPLIAIRYSYIFAYSYNQAPTFYSLSILQSTLIRVAF